MALDPALSAEDIRHNINAVVRLTVLSRAGMAGVKVGLVDDGKIFRREGFGQLLCDQILGSHRFALVAGGHKGQSRGVGGSLSRFDVKTCGGLRN